MTLAICANEAEWQAVERVALDEPGENMVSALRQLVDQLRDFLALEGSTPPVPR